MDANQSSSFGSTSEDLSKAVESFSAELKNYYRKKESWITPLPWMKTRPIDSYFIPLDLEIRDRPGGKSKGNTKDIGDILKSKEPRGDPPRTILITAPSGFGKSTLINKIAHDWSNGISESLLPFQILFVCVYSLKEFKMKDNLEACIAGELSKFYRNDCSVPWRLLLSEVQKRTLLLLDGYDQLQESSKEDFVEFLKKDREFFTVVVTTRPNQDDDLEMHFDRNVKTVPMKRSSCSLAVSKLLGKGDSDVETVCKIIRKSESDLGVTEISPLLLYSICYVLKNTDITRITKTSDLFYQVMFFMFKRAAEETSYNITDDEIKNILYRLGEMSMEMLLEGNYIFTQTELRSEFLINFNFIHEVGIFHRSTGTEREFEMLHRSFMESLAVKFWNTFPKPVPRKNIRLAIQNKLARINYSTEVFLLVNAEKQTYLVINLVGMFFLVKHGNALLGENKFELSNDFELIKKKSLCCFSVQTTTKYVHEIVQHMCRVDLLGTFASFSSEKEKTVLTFMGSYLFTAYLIFRYLSLLSEWNGLEKLLAVLIVSSFVFLLFLFLRMAHRLWALRLAECNKVTLAATFLASSPYFVATVLFSLTAIRFASLIPYAQAMFHVWLVLFGSSLATIDFVFPTAVMSLQNNQRLSSAVVLTTAIIVKRVFGYLLKPIKIVSVFYLISYIVLGLVENKNISDYFWNHALAYLVVCAGGTWIRQLIIRPLVVD